MGDENSSEEDDINEVDEFWNQKKAMEQFFCGMLHIDFFIIKNLSSVIECFMAVYYWMKKLFAILPNYI